MDNRPIGVFDSGVGGMTVLKELAKQLPNENFIYLGDTLNFPYGEKSKEEIVKYSRKNIEYLISQNVKMVVIACGTATSQALKEMKEIFSIPIIGIIKPTADYVTNVYKKGWSNCNNRNNKKWSLGKEPKRGNAIYRSCK